jgi:ribosomal protein L11 methyltransferase
MADSAAKGQVPLWSAVLVTDDADAAGAAMLALDPLFTSVSAFEIDDGKAWRVEGLTPARPDRALVEAALELVWRGRGTATPALVIDRLPPQDWLRENQASFQPISVGRYFVHGSHVAAKAARIDLLIDAATAFGTGEHATTRGCLMALDRLARRHPRRRVLDMGTGTGVLAIAAAKTWRRKVMARDIDPESVRVARHNARRNGVAALFDVRRSTGYRDPGLDRAAPFDLVLANILARPLALMARDLRRVLAPGGVAVLSGLLARHETFVLAAHRRHGMVVRHRIAIDGWHTLIVARRPSPTRPPSRKRA